MIQEQGFRYYASTQSFNHVPFQNLKIYRWQMLDILFPCLRSKHFLQKQRKLRDSQ